MGNTTSASDCKIGLTPWGIWYAMGPPLQPNPHIELGVFATYRCIATVATCFSKMARMRSSVVSSGQADPDISMVAKVDRPQSLVYIAQLISRERSMIGTKVGSSHPVHRALFFSV